MYNYFQPASSQTPNPNAPNFGGASNNAAGGYTYNPYQSVAGGHYGQPQQQQQPQYAQHHGPPGAGNTAALPSTRYPSPSVNQMPGNHGYGFQPKNNNIQIATGAGPNRGNAVQGNHVSPIHGTNSGNMANKPMTFVRSAPGSNITANSALSNPYVFNRQQPTGPGGAAPQLPTGGGQFSGPRPASFSGGYKRTYDNSSMFNTSSPLAKPGPRGQMPNTGPPFGLPAMFPFGSPAGMGSPRNKFMMPKRKKPKFEGPKDPKSLLHELRPGLNMTEVPDVKFAYKCIIDGVEYTAQATNKKAARTRLAEKILVEHLKQDIIPTATNIAEPIAPVIKYTPEQLAAKNPVALLNELSRGMHFEIGIDMDTEYKVPVFVASLNYKDKLYTTKGLSKIKAKSALSKILLKEIYDVDMGLDDEQTIEKFRKVKISTDANASANMGTPSNPQINAKPQMVMSGNLGQLQNSGLQRPFSAVLHEITRYDCNINHSPEQGGFNAVITFDGKVFTGWNSSKKGAKNQAAFNALRSAFFVNYDIPRLNGGDRIDTNPGENAVANVLKGLGDNFQIAPETGSQAVHPTNGIGDGVVSLPALDSSELLFRKIPPEFADIIGLVVLNKYKEIMELSHLNKMMFENSRMIAGIVMLKQTNENMPDMTLIAASNCTRCFDVTAITKFLPEHELLKRAKKKDYLTDSHAEVLCRKALQRFLWAKLPFDDPNGNDIFERLPDMPSQDDKSMPRFRIRSDIKFMFYASGFPCGSEMKVPVQTARKNIVNTDALAGMVDPSLLLNEGTNNFGLPVNQQQLTLCPGFSKQKVSDSLLVKSFFSYYHSKAGTASLDHDFADSSLIHDEELKQSLGEDEQSDAVANGEEHTATPKSVSSTPEANATLASCNLLKGMDYDQLPALIEKKIGIMSCVDKLMLWGIVGVQGKELTNFMEPVYFDGIISSTPYPLESLYRAIYGRSLHFLRPELFYSPDTYINSPILQKTTYRFVPQNSKNRFPHKKRPFSFGGRKFFKSPGKRRNDSNAEIEPSFHGEEDASTSAILNGSMEVNPLETDLLKQVSKIRSLKSYRNSKNFKQFRKPPSQLLPNFLKNSRFGFLWYQEPTTATASNNASGAESQDAPNVVGTLEIIDANKGKCFTDLTGVDQLAGAILICRAELKQAVESLRARRQSASALRNTIKLLSSKINVPSTTGVPQQQPVSDLDGDIKMKTIESEAVGENLNGGESGKDKVATATGKMSNELIQLAEIENLIKKDRETIGQRIEASKQLYAELMTKLDEHPLKPSGLCQASVAQIEDGVLAKCGFGEKEIAVLRDCDIYRCTKDAFKLYCESVVRIGTWMRLPH